MPKLETETRNAINDYFSYKINELEGKRKIFIKKFENEKIDEFKNSIIKRTIEENFLEIKKQFPELYIRCECEVYDYKSTFNYFEEKEYKKLNEEIEKLKLEKRKLIVTLESNSKNSNEYKKAIKEFINKMEKEN